AAAAVAEDRQQPPVGDLRQAADRVTGRGDRARPGGRIGHNAGVIRSYEPGDLPSLYDVCVRTADAGGDARHLYPDQDLMPTIFLAPYVALDPSLAFVIDDGSRAVGYVIATADTP